jgi:hypothetical protein
MEWNNGNVRQKPGPNNALGLVKFLFPIVIQFTFMTALPNLFLMKPTGHSVMDASGGQKLKSLHFTFCAMIQHGMSKKLTQAMNSGKEKYVTLKQTLPVFIAYFTSWVKQGWGAELSERYL